MALQLKWWLVTVVLSDQGGNKSTLRYELNPASLGAGTEYADAKVIEAAIVAALDAVTDSAIVQRSISETYAEDSTFFGTGENENVALIVSKLLAGLGKVTSFRVPNPIAAMFQAASGPDYNQVDPANALLQTYLQLFETDVLTSDGENIEDPTVSGNFVGKRIHRGSRKG